MENLTIQVRRFKSLKEGLITETEELNIIKEKAPYYNYRPVKLTVGKRTYIKKWMPEGTVTLPEEIAFIDQMTGEYKTGKIVDFYPEYSSREGEITGLDQLVVKSGIPSLTEREYNVAIKRDEVYFWDRSEMIGVPISDVSVGTLRSGWRNQANRELYIMDTDNLTALVSYDMPNGRRFYNVISRWNPNEYHTRIPAKWRDLVEADKVQYELLTR